MLVLVCKIWLSTGVCCNVVDKLLTGADKLGNFAQYIRNTYTIDHQCSTHKANYTTFTLRKVTSLSVNGFLR